MSPRFLRNLLLPALASAFFSAGLGAAPEAGQKLPPEIAAVAAPLVAELRRALVDRDEARVRAAAAKIISTEGEWAGVPDAAVRYHRPIDRAAPSLAALLAYWRAAESSMARRIPWVENPTADPKRMNAGLRVVADSVSGYAQLAGLLTSEREVDTARARAGADYLLRTQRPEGFFPFPDLRGRNGQFGPMIERLVRARPDAVANGWVLDDGGSGDLKYDTAFCGVALLDTWRLTADPRYRDGAIRAAKWAAGRPFTANWNYNAFSAWLLGEVAGETGDQVLLTAAVDHVFIGILPGLLANGRWFDQHNARLVYHGILVRGLIATWQALPESHPRRNELRRALDLALDNASSEIRTHGASSVSTSTEALALALRTFGDHPAWAEAAHINVNAVLADAGARDAEDFPSPGFYLVNYLAWRLAASGGGAAGGASSAGLRK